MKKIKQALHGKKSLESSINALLGAVFILAFLKKQWLIMSVLSIIGLLKWLVNSEKKKEVQAELDTIQTQNTPVLKQVTYNDSWAKVSEESAFLINEIERINPDLKNKDLNYVIDKLIEMLERLGFEMIDRDITYDIRFHDAIQEKDRVLKGTPIKQILRKGFKKGNRVYLKAKVIL